MPADDAALAAALVGWRSRETEGVRAVLDEAPLPSRAAAELKAACRRHGLTRGQTARLLLLRELSCRWQLPSDASAPPVTTPREALLQFQELRSSLKERFLVLYLNSRNQPLACETVAVGGLNSAALQPREVFAPALERAAAAVILAHNHPSGDPTPSPEDLAVTRRLQEAGRLLGVEVLDHLVICEDRFRSIREAGGLAV